MSVHEEFRILDNAHLTELARKAAEIEGYEGSVTAEYLITPSKLSVRWKRSHDWIQFQVSHWIADMDDDLVVEVFQKCFQYIIYGKTKEYSNSIAMWVDMNRHKWRVKE